jgi:ankyrin repeat protein
MTTLDVDSLYCPITREIYNEPVVAADGFTYEKDALIMWFKNHNTSPKTNKIIDRVYLRSFDKIQQVRDYLIDNPQKIDEKYIKKEDIIENIINTKNNYEILLNSKNFTGLTIDLNKIKDWKKLFTINTELLKKLINIFCKNSELINKDGRNPIHYICQYSTPEIIKYVIDIGFNLELRTEQGWKPIHFICKYSIPEVIKYIIDKGVDIECDTLAYCRPVHFICVYSTPEMLKYIINKGVELESIARNGNKLIHLICVYSTLEVVKLVINKGVDLEYSNNIGCKPIHSVFKSSDPDIIEYILLIYLKRNLDITSKIKMFENIKCDYTILDLIRLNGLFNNNEKEELIMLLNPYFNLPKSSNRSTIYTRMRKIICKFIRI